MTDASEASAVGAQAFTEYRTRSSFVALMLCYACIEWPEGQALPQIGGPLRSNDQTERDAFMLSILSDMAEALPDEPGLVNCCRLARLVAAQPEAADLALLSLAVGLRMGRVPASSEAFVRSLSLEAGNAQRAAEAEARYDGLREYATARRTATPTIPAAHIARHFARDRRRDTDLRIGEAGVLKELQRLIRAGEVPERAKNPEGGSVVPLFGDAMD